MRPGRTRHLREAKRLYEEALAGEGGSDPKALLEYGHLLECHGRNSLRQAVTLYERAIELDPDADQPHYQLIWACAALRETERPVALHQQRLAQSPADIREHRFLANAYLAARQYPRAARVIDAGLALDPDDRMLLEARGQAGRDRRSGQRAGRLAPRDRPRWRS
jgi:tetratricopeptide (TPR) repeat protein